MKSTERAKPRNQMHDHPLMRKCSTHGKSRKAQRANDRVALRQGRDAYLSCHMAVELSAGRRYRHTLQGQSHG